MKLPTLNRRRLLASAVAAVTTAFSPIAAGAAPDTEAADADPERGRIAEHVVMFDLDGFDPRFLEGEYAGLAELPNIRALAEQGAFGVAHGSYKSYSNSSRAATATGTYPDVHGNGAYYYDGANDLAVGQERYLEPGVETIAQSLRAQGRTAAYLQWYIVENFGAAYGDPQALYTQPGGNCVSRASQAVDILAGRPVISRGQPVQLPAIPDLITVYCGDVDTVLHDQGFSGINLVPALEHVDEQVGRVLQAARDAGVYDTTTFIVTGDHAMRTWTRPLLPSLLAALESTGFTAQVVPAGGSAAPETDIVVVQGVRIADLTFRGAATRPQNIARVRRAVAAIEGVAAVYDRGDQRRLRAGDKAGQLVVDALEPYHFSTTMDGRDRASHGGADEAEVPLIIAGAGVRPGTELRNSRLIDVAPTISALLGVAPPNHAEGRVLREALLPGQS